MNRNSTRRIDLMILLIGRRGILWRIVLTGNGWLVVRSVLRLPLPLGGSTWFGSPVLCTRSFLSTGVRISDAMHSETNFPFFALPRTRKTHSPYDLYIYIGSADPATHKIYIWDLSNDGQFSTALDGGREPLAHIHVRKFVGSLSPFMFQRIHRN